MKGSWAYFQPSSSRLKYVCDMSSSCSFVYTYFNLASFRLLHQDDRGPQGHMMCGDMWAHTLVCVQLEWETMVQGARIRKTAGHTGEKDKHQDYRA